MANDSMANGSMANGSMANGSTPPEDAKTPSRRQMIHLALATAPVLVTLKAGPAGAASGGSAYTQPETTLFGPDQKNNYLFPEDAAQ